MKLDIRAKLVLVSLGLIAVSILVLEVAVRRQLEHDIVDGIRDDLFGRLDLIEYQAAGRSIDLGPADWDHWADEFGRRSHLRVTVVRADGVVIGDSDVELPALAGLENHRDRPEIAAALRGQRGDAIRWSGTLRHRLFYAAVPVRSADGQGVVGAVRVAEPLGRLEGAVGRFHRALVIAAFLALSVSVVMATIAAQLMSRALRGITQAARRMSSGDLDVRIRLSGEDEIGALGRTLDGLAENLSQSLTALRGERDLLGRMLESMQEGVLVLDRNLRILLINRALREMLLLGSDLVGRLPIETIRNAELQAVLDSSASTGKSASGEVEMAGLGPRRFMVHSTPLGGEPRGLVAVFVDVTEIRRLETMRKDFVANVSHELRTPIAAVRSAAETARRAIEKDPEAAVRFVDMIERNALRLQDLVEDLLELSRIESKQFRPQSEAVNIAELAELVLAQFREAGEKKHLTMSLVTPPGPSIARADKRAVEQILTNLIENAVKYCRDNVSVTVRVVEREGIFRVSVEDTGPGIEPKHLPRLFERFYRADKGRSRDMGGTGLGLSIVKHLVETMGGNVSVESTPGKGTTFSFTLRA
ncbi:MAG TPA: ATP-binding protein [Polyangia bacterium]|jgi:two-component system phosphate regulon sensor histidine kinase PhoR